MHVFVRPSPILAPFVESLWYVENYGQGWERVLPSGGIQLLVNLYADELWSWNDTCGTTSRVRGAALEGPRSAPILIDNARLRAMIGVAFRPGGIHPFFPPPASAAAGELVELTELWGQEGELVRERLLEAASPATKLRVLEQVLIARAVRPVVVDRPGAFAVAALDRGSPVRTVADRLGMISKRFAHGFTARVGLRPKQFARIRRFQRLLRATFEEDHMDWAQLAVECGYYDQAHMIRDFRAFSGMNPRSDTPRSEREHNHVPYPPTDDGAISSNRSATRVAMMSA
jgi:AraC-like DNA-binding protein